MGHWASRKIETNSLLEYQAHNNSSSLDGCPGMRTAMRDHGERVWLTLMKAEIRKLYAQKKALILSAVVGMVLLLLFQTVLSRVGMFTQI